MSLESAIHYHLVHRPAVAALVGERIYKGVLPAGQSLPAITINEVAYQPEHHQGGGSSAAMARWQISAWANDPDAAEAVREAVRLSLDGFAGLLGKPGSEVPVLGSSHAGNHNDHTPPAGGGNVGTWHRAIDFEIWHRVAVASWS